MTRYYGPNHSVVVDHDGVVQIGCISKPIDEWLKDYWIIGKKHKYSDEEIELYHTILLDIKKYGKIKDSFNFPTAEQMREFTCKTFRCKYYNDDPNIACNHRAAPPTVDRIDWIYRPSNCGLQKR